MKRTKQLFAAAALVIGALMLSAAAPSAVEIAVGTSNVRTSALDVGTAWVRCDGLAYYAVGTSTVNATASSTALANVNLWTPVTVTAGQYIALRAKSSGKCWVTQHEPAAASDAGTGSVVQSGTVETGFAATVALGSVCVCTDVTGVAATACPVSGTSMTAAGTGGHMLAYLCTVP